MMAPRKPDPRRVQAVLRRLRAWHGGQLQTALGQLRRVEPRRSRAPTAERASRSVEEMGTAAKDPFEVLIGTLLSHRTRDDRTYEGTKRLFARYPDAARLARARPADVKVILKAAHVGFYNVKAPRVIEVARLISEDHDGTVPDTEERLLALPGVGRKTANCVLVYGFSKAAIPVDTHVHRISNRLGWVRTRDPEDTEAALATLVPPKDWLLLNELFVSYGKEVCRPVGPRCGACVVAGLCPSRRVGPEGRQRPSGT